MKARSYEIRTYGCQMNVHDSERLAGLLEAAGYERADAAGSPDLVVFNTCAVRENADNRLYGNLGHLYPAKAANPDMQIAVGGCLAQKDRGRHRREGAVGRRRLRHPQPRRPARPARTGPAQPRGPGRDRRGAAELPVRPAHPPRLGAQRLGVDLGRLRQHLHVLHRPVAARRRDRPPPRRRAGRDPRPGRRRRRRGDPARAERQLLRPLVRRPVRVRQAAAGLRRDRRPGAGAVHQPAPARLHRRRHRRDGGDAQRHAAAAHADAVRLGHGAQGDAPLVPAASATSPSSTSVRAAMPDAAITHRHHRRLPGRDRGRLRADAGRGAGGALQPARSPSSTRSGRARRPPRWPGRCPRRSCRNATSG